MAGKDKSVSDGAGHAPGRRRVLRAGAAVGISSVALPAAAVAASASVVEAWSGTLTFSDVSETGFTVSWTGV